jgi:hypothetical protein
MKRTIRALAVSAAALMAVVSIASAAVTFDPEEGTGFVGKGDVQVAFGWNNKQLQANADLLKFTYEESGRYTLLCSRIHPTKGYQEKTFKNRTVGVFGEVDYEPRLKNGQKQFTGFILGSYTGELVDQSQSCPGGWPTEVSRTANDDEGTILGLYVHHGEDDEEVSVLIWSPAP